VIAYAATVAAFWAAVCLLTLLACRAIDRAVSLNEIRRARSRAYRRRASS
jgi:hypothetical protein